MFDDMKADRGLAIFVGVLLFVAMLEGQLGGVLILLVILGGIFAFARRRDRFGGRETRSSRRDDDYEDIYEDDAPIVRRNRPASSDQVHNHALQAVRRAGLNPDDLKVLPVDIGLMSFHGDENPVVHRNAPIDDDCDYIQPYVQLRVPRVAAGKVRFEIFDANRKPLFIHEDRYQLERGRNLIIPAARLPVHDEFDAEGRWEMRVTADNVVLARYTFEWNSSEDEGFHRHIGEDGEINSELRAVLAESRLQKMSLDDLLGDQEEDDAPQQKQSR